MKKLNKFRSLYIKYVAELQNFFYLSKLHDLNFRREDVSGIENTMLEVGTKIKALKVELMELATLFTFQSIDPYFETDDAIKWGNIYKFVTTELKKWNEGFYGRSPSDEDFDSINIQFLYTIQSAYSKKLNKDQLINDALPVEKEFTYREEIFAYQFKVDARIEDGRSAADWVKINPGYRKPYYTIYGGPKYRIPIKTKELKNIIKILSGYPSAEKIAINKLAELESL